ncbi:energy-coupling factor transporter transmembrane component T family protein [Alkalibacter mobilis]|uniref:energy-coupling factor transporter transmembrane component T family protein n=1 Tax=Alkalibacter mobilis TaxID=2787712 RepID=UPI0018A1207D|nr:energy-coupling factor transporter transmembrane component T [Alkalibacter mobilis]MBF7097768.1 energy-coupling factor transporter transmembrane protein EcfT [Alkalibacter mobilis]
MLMNNFNPTAKLIANLIIVITSLIVFDPHTMGMLFVISSIFVLVTKSVNRKNLKAIVPLVCFAVGMLWMNASLARVENPQIIATLGPLRFTDQGLIIGLVLFFRIMTIGITSILFTFNTEPDVLILSLIKQCRLNPGIAYGMMTALRFLPSMESDLELMNAAHRIRNVRNKKWNLKKNSWYKNAIPLLAANIRKAERVAIAMEARGFQSDMKRTYYRTVNWGRRDTIFVALTVLIVCAIVLFSNSMGWLICFKGWRGF